MRTSLGKILAGTGTILGLAAIYSAVAFDGGWLEFYGVGVRDIRVELMEGSLRTPSYVDCDLCAQVFPSTKIRIYAPQLMRVDETQLISFTQQIYGYGGEEFQTIFYDLDVTLSGANFIVKPQESRVIEEGSSLPARLVWTIQPNRTGHHLLLLDFSRLTIHDRRPVTSIFHDNDHEIRRSLESKGVFEIPITVVSEWGISNRAVSLIRGALALGGFILVTPALWAGVHLVMKRLNPPSQILKP